MLLAILPVHVVVLHSWVWLVFAIETGLLRGKILKIKLIILHFTPDGAIITLLNNLTQTQ